MDLHYFSLTWSINHIHTQNWSKHNNIRIMNYYKNQTFQKSNIENERFLNINNIVTS